MEIPLKWKKIIETISIILFYYYYYQISLELLPKSLNAKSSEAARYL